MSEQAATLEKPTQGENDGGQRCHFGPVRDVSKEVEALYDATHERPRGSLVKHEEIQDITGHEKLITDGQGRLVDNPLYWKIVKKWRRKMLAGPGIEPVSSRGVGFRYPTVDEQLTDVVDQKEKSAARKIKSTQSTMECIHDEELSDFQKRLRRERLRQTNEKKQLNSTHVAERRQFHSNPDTLPKWGG